MTSLDISKLPHLSSIISGVNPVSSVNLSNTIIAENMNINSNWQNIKIDKDV